MRRFAIALFSYFILATAALNAGADQRNDGLNMTIGPILRPNELLIELQVVNESNIERPIPNIRIVVRDESNNDIAMRILEPPIKTLAPGTKSATFQTSFQVTRPHSWDVYFADELPKPTVAVAQDERSLPRDLGGISLGMTLDEVMRAVKISPYSSFEANSSGWGDKWVSCPPRSAGWSRGPSKYGEFRFSGSPVIGLENFALLDFTPTIPDNYRLLVPGAGFPNPVVWRIAISYQTPSGDELKKRLVEKFGPTTLVKNPPAYRWGKCGGLHAIHHFGNQVILQDDQILKSKEDEYFRHWEQTKSRQSTQQKL